MTFDNWIPLIIVIIPLFIAMIIFALAEDKTKTRSILNIGASLLSLGLVGLMLWGVSIGQSYETRVSFLPGLDLVLRADSLSLLFVTLSSALWMLTTVYAIGYLEGSPHRSRFFGFFSLCVAATLGVALAGNLLTFLLFYELLTLATYPLIVHRGTAEVRRAGRIYLIYTLTGGAFLLLGTVLLYSITGTLEFVEGGFLSALDSSTHGLLIFVFVLLIIGLGVKAAIVPLHGWLPKSMVAPAPVSALLHAVAVVKAGAFGIVRVIYDVFGIEFSVSLGLTLPLAIIASITIIYASMRALFQDGLKARLAYSTVSQVSYIILGVAIAGPVAAIGGVVHLVHQGVTKITLFFCAGNFAETLGIHNISQMHGVGRRMPWTMAAFTIGALGMIGIPPLAGFISKWYLGLGALEAGRVWILWVLAGSSLLNAAYFLPVLYVAWFKKPKGDWPVEQKFGKYETSLLLLMPPLITALFVVLLGLFASLPFSALAWTEFIISKEFLL